MKRHKEQTAHQEILKRTSYQPTAKTTKKNIIKSQTVKLGNKCLFLYLAVGEKKV